MCKRINNITVMNEMNSGEYDRYQSNFTYAGKSLRGEHGWLDLHSSPPKI